MSMFGINAHKSTRRSISRSPAARRRNSIRATIEKEMKESGTPEKKVNSEEQRLQRHQSCHNTRPTNRNDSETSTSYNTGTTLTSSSTSANNNPPPPSNATSASPSKTLSSSCNVRPPSLHHRSPHLQERYHQTLTQSSSISESTRYYIYLRIFR